MVAPPYAGGACSLVGAAMWVLSHHAELSHCRRAAGSRTARLHSRHQRAEHLAGTLRNKSTLCPEQQHNRAAAAVRRAHQRVRRALPQTSIMRAQLLRHSTTQHSTACAAHLLKLGLRLIQGVSVLGEDNHPAVRWGHSGTAERERSQ